MNAGRDIAAPDAAPPRCTSRIVLRYGRAACVGTIAALVRARRTRAGRVVGKTPALRAARPTGRAADVREQRHLARAAHGRIP